MRRVFLVGGVALGLVAAFGGGYVVGHAVDDQEPQHGEITNAEHDRLLDACMAATSEPATCPEWVAGVVQEVEDAGCGYDTATELLAWYFDPRHRDALPETRGRAARRILDDC